MKYVLILLKCFLACFALIKASRLETGNIVSAVFFILLILFFRIADKKKEASGERNTRSLRITSAVISAVFTLFYVAYDYPAYTEGYKFFLIKAAVMLCAVCGFFILFYELVSVLYLYISYRELIGRLFFSDRRLPLYRKHILLMTMASCFICYLPYFLFQFPGIMTPDSLNQYAQAAGIVSYSNHFPWLHTLTIKFFYSIGKLFTSSEEAAVSFYTLAQMLFLSLAIGYMLSTLEKINASTPVLLVLNAYFALMPYHAIYSVTIWKEIPFGAGMLIFVCSLFRLSKSASVRDTVVYALSGFMFALFRSNGLYAFYATLPFLIWHFRKKFVLIAVTIGIFISTLAMYGFVMPAFKVEQPDFVQSLAIPVQQVANVLCNDRELTDEEYALVDSVIDRKWVKELYVPTYAGNIQELVRAGHPEYLEEHKGEFLVLWFKLLLRYPGDYISAYINQTYGYWFPDAYYPIAENEGITSNDLGLSHSPIISGFILVKGKAILLNLGTVTPIFGLLWSTGCAAWILILCMGAVIAKKMCRKLIYFLPVFFTWLTVLIATPEATAFRYVYFMFLTVPFYAVVALAEPVHNHADNFLLKAYLDKSKD